MPRDLKLNVDGDSKGASRALDEAALGAETAARAADRLAAQFRQATKDAAKLDRQLAETAIATKALAREFAATGDKGIKQQLDAQKKAASELKNLRKDIIGDTEKAAKDAEKLAASAAKEFSDLQKQVENTGSSIGEMFSKGPLGLGSPPGLVIGGATATVGGAALGGLAAAGAGATVAGAGIAGAALGDPKEFAAHWNPVVADLKARFLDATYVFRDPGLSAIDSIGTAIKSWDLKGLFAAAVPYVAPLVDGTEQAAGYIIDGVKHLTQDAGPAIKVLSQDLGGIGESIDTALSAIGSQAQGGADGLHALDKAIEDVILGVGYFVAGAEAITGAVHDASTSAEHFFDSIPGWVRVALPFLELYKKVFDQASSTDDASANAAHFGHVLDGVTLTGNLAADAAKAQADDYAELSKQLNATAITADTLAGAMTDKLIGSLLAGDHAALSWNESLTSLSKSFQDNGKNIDIHTAKGQANREAVLASVAANVQLYDTQIAAGATAEDAAAAYDANTAALEKNLKKAGLTSAQIQDLIGKYENVPDHVNTTIAVEGLTKAIEDLNATIRLINGIHDKQATISVTTVYHTKGSPNVGEGGTQVLKGAFAKGGIRHAATGLIIGPSDPGTLIGEPQTGGELLLPLQGISTARAASLAQRGLAGYGLDVVPRSGHIPPHLFGGGGAAGTATPQLVYNGSSGGLDGMFVTWLAQKLRTGELHLVVSPSGQVRAA